MNQQNIVRQLTEKNENLERELKMLTSIEESNCILKADIIDLRKRAKEERNNFLSKINKLESKLRSMESTQVEIKSLAIRIADISSMVSTRTVALPQGEHCMLVGSEQPLHSLNGTNSVGLQKQTKGNSIISFFLTVNALLLLLLLLEIQRNHSPKQFLFCRL